MKSKLLFFNLALILYLVGLAFGLDSNLQVGAIFVLLGASIIAILYFDIIWKAIQNKTILTWDNLILSIGLFALAVLFIHGFSVSIDFMFFRKLLWFDALYFPAGFILIFLFQYLISQLVPKDRRIWLIGGTSISTIMAFIGMIGYAGWLPLPPRLVFYSWVFFIWFLSILLLFLCFRGDMNSRKEYRIFLLLSLVMIGFWLFRFVSTPLILSGLLKATLDFGLVPLLILPIAILAVKRFYPFVIFAFYFVCLDIYFIHFDRNFNDLVNIGINGCANYYQEITYLVNTSPEISLLELSKQPIQSELDDIVEEWKNKPFPVVAPEVVYEELQSNGDTIKVIAHSVDGKVHYGAVRIPNGLDVMKAPIVMELEGGGTGIDVSKISTLSRGKCWEEKNQFISILPSYRGNVLRGENFCFRSEGYFGDAWHGASIDAITFLEVVKAYYHKPANTPVLIDGLSRGATVALIIGSLTDKADFIIANSTHSKFVDPYVINHERVGKSLMRAFAIPAASKQEIRKRMITSSPYFFADHLPPFQLHQGTEDHLTTIWHANQLKQRLNDLGKNNANYEFVIYEGEGHGYDDGEIVCKTVRDFLGQFQE